MAIKSKGIGKQLCDYLKRNNLDLMLIGIILACYHASAVYAESPSTQDNDDHGDDGGHATSAADGGDNGHDSGHELTEHEIAEGGHHAVKAVFFPWFAEIIGVFGYYVVSRYAHQVPYTALMFVVGACIGWSVKIYDDNDFHTNDIVESAGTWLNINGHVILLVFLPGLLYLDSFNIDVHLFTQSFAQLLTFAFPMVLAGTTLTALVARFIFPYGWSFDLCMTFGSILAATDPVAVAVLLNELGAPPRLKIHVSGESLLNDGSAVVFFNIFSARFWYEIGVEDVGENIGWGQGFLMFFRLSLGGMCIGIAFGLGLLIILYKLDRRLSGEDSVVQVVATITTAYLVFFTAEILAKCSGIIAVVFCGVVVKAFGEHLYNDPHLSHHFWEITEYLLNTLLFTLGGCLWGETISKFEGKDWGYLFMLYALVIVIRFFLVFAFYPITANIGIGTSWREAVFMAYGGLRGAVGIALGLVLYAETVHYTAASEVSTETRDEFILYTEKVFGMVGGIALLTLVINAPTCGLLLKALGIITPTETRNKVVENYRQHMIHSTLVDFVSLLTQKRFQDTDFTVVKQHVSFLRDITYEQLMVAVKQHKDSSPASSYQEPDLKNVIPYLYKGNVASGHAGDTPRTSDVRSRKDLKLERFKSVRVIRDSKAQGPKGKRGTVFDFKIRYDDHESRVQEERLVFIKILHSAYHHLTHSGELYSRGNLINNIFDSLAIAEDAAEAGEPLSDWDAMDVFFDSHRKQMENFLVKAIAGVINFDLDFYLVHFRVRQILAFVHAHGMARKIFKEEFNQAGKDCLTEAEKIVLDESDMEVQLAEGAMEELLEEDVAMVKSLLLCHIVLNKSADYFKKLADEGLMSGKEASEFLEHIEDEISHILKTKEVDHSAELSDTTKVARLSQISMDPELMQGLLSEDHGPNAL